MDVATVNPATTSLSVLLNHGDGSFAAPISYGVGSAGPADIKAVDLNGDLKLDLVTGNYNGNSVSVLLGNSDGTFAPAAVTSLAIAPKSVAFADFNLDGKKDLVLGTQFSGGLPDVTVLLGNGDGTFAAPVYINLSTTESFGVAAGYLNGDANPDIVAADQGGSMLHILLGNGDGTFASPGSLAVGTEPTTAVIADFDGNGLADLATPNFIGDNVSVLLQQAGFAFARKDFASGNSPQSIAVADINHDCILDLAVANHHDRNVTVFLGNGDGTFAAPVVTGTMVGNLHTVLVANFNPLKEVGSIFAPGNSPLSPFVALGKEGIWLKQGATVISGDVGASEASSGPFLSDQSEVTIGQSVQCLGLTSRVMGDTVKIKIGAAVREVYYNDLENNGQILGQQLTPVTLPLVSAFPAVPAFMPGPQNFDVPANGSLTLPPGDYGTLLARQNATITLSGGIYNFAEWDLRDDVKLHVEGPAEIRVAGKLNTNLRTFVGPAPASGLSATDIRIVVTGINGNVGNIGNTPKAAEFGMNNTLVANVYAPSGTLFLRQGSAATGAFLGRWVVIGENVSLTQQSGF